MDNLLILISIAVVIKTSTFVYPRILNKININLDISKY